MDFDTIRRLLGRLAILLSSAVALLAVATVIVAPLWILATKARFWYNALVGLALLGLAARVLVGRLRSARPGGARGKAPEAGGKKR